MGNMSGSKFRTLSETEKNDIVLALREKAKGDAKAAEEVRKGPRGEAFPPTEDSGTMRIVRQLEQQATREDALADSIEESVVKIGFEV